MKKKAKQSELSVNRNGEGILKSRQEQKDIKTNLINSIINMLNGLSYAKAEGVLTDCINEIKVKSKIQI